MPGDAEAMAGYDKDELGKGRRLFGRGRNQALNLYSINDHATLECRVFPSTLDPARFRECLAAWATWCESLDPTALEARAVELQPFFEAGRARAAEFMASVQRHILANQPLFERDYELERRARAARIPVPRRRPHEQLRDWSKVVWPDGTVGIPADLAGS
jgi:hypothetical protein